eukprot:Hpha_TRINITY_DN30959_c0_g1::TRINITY_DN30959_c0_g1_i1::g.112226::m.112226
MPPPGTRRNRVNRREGQGGRVAGGAGGFDLSRCWAIAQDFLDTITADVSTETWRDFAGPLQPADVVQLSPAELRNRVTRNMTFFKRKYMMVAAVSFTLFFVSIGGIGAAVVTVVAAILGAGLLPGRLPLDLDEEEETIAAALLSALVVGLLTGAIKAAATSMVLVGLVCTLHAAIRPVQVRERAIDAAQQCSLM